ncbi:peptidoglycan DD-metalloendopeptidase family protein [Tenacibaculum retecalamus]|uniref:peptidoglycan DD-metalloendopeptidase family protein n=1 Tax=Tenacibaculum retecalamus TaxID=3018315 RepID=UPI0023D8ED99|nr:peptidoglycan DD-metalloendopeptidase family protein [Tenacibaculum retecalamus]WBX70140.1 peptidoglycan DD-metalloendopeptidase family protein [Tenacibaculum retecalamus]
MKDLLNKISEEPLKVIDSSITFEEYIHISISSENKQLNFDVSSSSEWEIYIAQYLKEKNAKVAFGGYLEKRDIYNRSEYFTKQLKENQRNIHLGIDLWCDANTAVLAVLNGEIHSFKNNTNHGDYGSTIILKHTFGDRVFYSLYGHLSEDSLNNLSVGDKVSQGEKIAVLGDNSVNGDYAPHLHFQLIIDMEGNQGDYPGVSSEKTLNFYKENCPNPNLLLKLPNEV